MPRRAPDQIRPLVIRPHAMVHPEGSALVALGDTQVLCSASLDDRVPPWMQGRGRGWVTAEYDMLPRATHSRSARDAVRGKVSGRTQEIGRLIARSLRSAVNLNALGERSITVDCDVLQADGGTRTAAITGGFVALALAIGELVRRGQVPATALSGSVSAISVGVVDGALQLDLDYGLDSRAEVDMNIVMNGHGNFIEVQGTGENAAFSRAQLMAMCDLAAAVQPDIRRQQEAAIAAPYHPHGLLAPGG